MFAGMEGSDALTRQLGASPPEQIVAQLSDEDAADLAEAIGEARHKLGRALDAAGNDAMRYVPKLLRGPIKKAMGIKE